MFEQIIIRTVKNGWPIDFVLKPGTQPGPAIEWLEEHGYQPAEEATGRAVEVQNMPEIGTFPAQELSATVNDGKAYWKVKGDRFQKFGVTVWPEVLEAAGFEVETLNPLKPVDLTGWMATYVVKENGMPQKIVRLEQVAAEEV